MNQAVKTSRPVPPKRPAIMVIAICSIFIANIIKLASAWIFSFDSLVTISWLPIICQVLSLIALVLMLGRIYAGNRGWLIAMLVFVSLGVCGQLGMIILKPTMTLLQISFAMGVVCLVAILSLFGRTTRDWVAKMKTMGLYKKRGGVTALIIVLFVVTAGMLGVYLVEKITSGAQKKQFIAKLNQRMPGTFCHNMLKSPVQKNALNVFGITKDNCMTKIAPMVKQCNIEVSVSMPAHISIKTSRVWGKQLISCLIKKIES